MVERRLPIPERPWHRSKSGCWSLSLGVRGLKVRVEQRKPGGTFQRVYRVAGRRVTYASLGTTDRQEARQLAIDFIRELENGKKVNLVEPLTLERLWDRYQQEASSYRGNLERTRRQKQTDVRLLIAGLGATKRVDHLTKNDVERYVAMRRTGHGWPDGRETKPVRARTIQGEIKQLRQMIYWAMSERLPDGAWLLENNPLRGVKLPKEEDPRRPVATYDRFLKLREAAQDMAATAPQQRGRDRWKRWEMALVLAEATGARIGAISGLCWSDLSSDPPEIKFRAEFDKRGRDRVVPIPEGLAEELRRFKVKFAAVGDGWLFPCADKDDHWPREIFGELYDRVERHAGLPHLKGGRFHPFRRKWATERKNMSLVDVMAAGGWRDAQTLHGCYQLATTDGMLEVMSTPVKLRDRKVSSK
jgi:integrase